MSNYLDELEYETTEGVVLFVGVTGYSAGSPGVGPSFNRKTGDLIDPGDPPDPEELEWELFAVELYGEDGELEAELTDSHNLDHYSTEYETEITDWLLTKIHEDQQEAEAEAKAARLGIDY